MSRHWQIPFCCLAAMAIFVTVAPAADFVPPPEAERQAVAALAKPGTRIVVDGDYRVVQITLGSESSNEELKRLANFERLTQLQISCPAITDDGLEHLKNLKKLTSIMVSASGTTEQGLASLRTALPECRVSGFPTRGVFPSTTTGPGPSNRESRGDRGDRFGPGERVPRTTSGFTTFGDRGSTGPTTFGSRTRLQTLAGNVAVQDDLKLSNEQRQQVNSLGDTVTVNRLIDEKIAEALTPEQRGRLKQIELQQAGITALSRQEVANELKLSDTQLAELRKVSDESSAALRNASREARNDNQETAASMRERLLGMTKQREEKMLAVLSEEQRLAWQKMLGPKGPELATINSSRGPLTSVEDLSRSLFSRYDTDQDGSLSDAEFPESNRTRSSMSRSGVTLTFPVKREDFEKAYAKYVESLRPRQ